MDERFERLRRWLAVTLRIEPERITPDTRLRDLAAGSQVLRPQAEERAATQSWIDSIAPDSLALAELLIAAEEDLDLRIPAEVAERALEELTVGELVRYLR